MKKGVTKGLLVSLVLISIFSFSACGGVVAKGKWEATEFSISTVLGSIDGMKDGTGFFKMEFESDKTYSISVSLPSINGAIETVKSMAGTWKENTSEVILTAEDKSEKIFEKKENELIYEGELVGVTIKVVLKKVQG